MPARSPRARTQTARVEQAALRLMVAQFRQTGEVPDELGRALVTIAGGVWERFRYTSDKDDFVQDVVVHLLQRPLDTAKADGNLFSFFYTCCVRFGMKLRDKATVDRRRFETYAQECVEAGRELATLGEYRGRRDDSE